MEKVAPNPATRNKNCDLIYKGKFSALSKCVFVTGYLGGPRPRNSSQEPAKFALLIPVYKLMESIPATRKGALHLGLVTPKQTLDCLVDAVEAPLAGVRIVEVAEIRAARAFAQDLQRAARPKHLADESNNQNYQSAWTWDIYSLHRVGEMLRSL